MSEGLVLADIRRGCAFVAFVVDDDQESAVAIADEAFRLGRVEQLERILNVMWLNLDDDEVVRLLTGVPHLRTMCARLALQEARGQTATPSGRWMLP